MKNLFKALALLCTLVLLVCSFAACDSGDVYAPDSGTNSSSKDDASSVDSTASGETQETDSSTTDGASSADSTSSIDDESNNSSDASTNTSGSNDTAQSGESTPTQGDSSQDNSSVVSIIEGDHGPIVRF